MIVPFSTLAPFLIMFCQAVLQEARKQDLELQTASDKATQARADLSRLTQQISAATEELSLVQKRIAAAAAAPALSQQPMMMWGGSECTRPSGLVSQLQSELEASLGRTQAADLKRRLAEGRAAEAEQEAQEARQAAARLKSRLAAVQEEAATMEEALQRERAAGSRLRQALQQQQQQQGVEGSFATLGGMASSIGADVDSMQLQLRRLQQQASRQTSLNAELEEEGRQARPRCSSAQQDLDGLLQQQQQARHSAEQSKREAELQAEALQRARQELQQVWGRGLGSVHWP